MRVAKGQAFSKGDIPKRGQRQTTQGSFRNAEMNYRLKHKFPNDVNLNHPQTTCDEVKKIIGRIQGDAQTRRQFPLRAEKGQTFFRRRRPKTRAKANSAEILSQSRRDFLAQAQIPKRCQFEPSSNDMRWDKMNYRPNVRTFLNATPISTSPLRKRFGNPVFEMWDWGFYLAGRDFCLLWF